MRKFRLAPLAAVTLAGALSLSACGKAPNTKAADKNLAFSRLPECPLDAMAKAPKPVKIALWTDAQVESENSLKEVAADFNKSQGDVQVEIAKPPIPGKAAPTISAGDVYRAYAQLNSLTSNEGGLPQQVVAPDTPMPALVALDSYRLRAMSDSGVVLPAQSCINASKFDTSTLAPALKAYYSIGGVQWPAYAVAAMPMMEFNAEHFTKAGLDPAKPPATLKDVEAAARKMRAAGISEHPIALPMDPNLIESWLTGAGASLVSNGNGRESPPQRATFYSEAAVELFNDLKRMVDDGLVKLYDNSDGSIGHLIALATGSASITFEPSSSTTSIAAVVDGDEQATEQAQHLEGGGSLSGTVTTDYRAAPFPGLKRSGQASISGSAWYISRSVDPAQQAAAWKFVQYMYKPEVQVKMLTKGGYLPLTTNVATNAEVTTYWTKGRMAGRWLKVADDQLNSLSPDQPGPLIGPYEDYFTVMRQALQQLQDDPTMTPSQILIAAESKFSTNLDTYNAGHG